MKSSLLEQYVGMLVESELTELAREPFSLDSLKGINNPKQLMKVLGQQFGPPIGGGVARVAYAYGNNQVLKVAYAGGDAAEHNKKEVKNAACLGKQYAIQVYDWDKENFLWIVEERVQKTTIEQLETKFQELAGIPLDIEQIRDLFARSPDMQNVHQHLYGKSKWYSGLADKLKSCNAGAEDFHQNNWGIRQSTGELVLLDLGF